MPIKWPNRYSGGYGAGVFRPKIGQFWFEQTDGSTNIQISVYNGDLTRFEHIDGTIVESNAALITSSGRWDVFPNWQMVMTITVNSNTFSRMALTNNLVAYMACHDGTLEYVDVRGASQLSYLDLHNNSLSSDAVDSVIIALVNSGNHGEVLMLQGNSPPGVYGSVYSSVLAARGWTVVTD